MAKQNDIYQYRFTADRIIEACRLQHRRVTGDDGVVPHDLDFYVLSVARLGELIRKSAHKLQLEGAANLDERFRSEFPHLETVRDWLMHPAEIERLGMASSFSDVLYRMLPGAGAEALFDARTAQSKVEALYADLCGLLGEIPER